MHTPPHDIFHGGGFFPISANFTTAVEALDIRKPLRINTYKNLGKTINFDSPNIVMELLIAVLKYCKSISVNYEHPLIY